MSFLLAELVWKVGRYTSAAPYYFTECEDYIDGGILANNPSEAALTVIQDHYHKQGKKIPTGKGVLIFDEVKVQNKASRVSSIIILLW